MMRVARGCGLTRSVFFSPPQIGAGKNLPTLIGVVIMFSYNKNANIEGFLFLLPFFFESLYLRFSVRKHPKNAN
jgi:hypothetical protein